MDLGSYKDFIDSVVSVSDSIPASWVERGEYPATESNEYRNSVLATLTNEQKSELARIVQESKESGIHDLLTLISETSKINYNGNSLPREPFGTELNFDYVARLNGEDWPK